MVECTLFIYGARASEIVAAFAGRGFGGMLFFGGGVLRCTFCVSRVVVLFWALIQPGWSSWYSKKDRFKAIILAFFAVSREWHNNTIVWLHCAFQRLRPDTQP